MTSSGTRQVVVARGAADPASSGWLARIAALHANDVLAVRLFAGIEICVHEEWAWVRGPQLTQALEQTLRTIPGLLRCTGLPGGPATVHGRQMPSGVVPANGWSPLRASFALTTPRPALPGQVGQRSALRVVRSRVEQPCSLLRCTWAEVAAWVEHAPEHRFSGLRYAASGGNSAGEALLRGQPLPLLHGTRHWQLGPLALPAGWTIDPPLTADDAFTLTGAGADDVVLVDEKQWHAIDTGSWMRVTRSAIRATGAAHD